MVFGLIVIIFCISFYVLQVESVIRDSYSIFVLVGLQCMDGWKVMY